MIFIALIHVKNSIKHCIFILGVNCQIIKGGKHHVVMSFYIRLITHIESKLVTQVIKHRMIGVMGRAHSVKIECFYGQQIFSQAILIEYISCISHSMSPVRVVFVAINTFNQRGIAIDKKHTLFYFHGTKTYFLLNSLNQMVSFIQNIKV